MLVAVGPVGAQRLIEPIRPPVERIRPIEPPRPEARPMVPEGPNRNPLGPHIGPESPVTRGNADFVAGRAQTQIEAGRPVEAINQLHEGREALPPAQRVQLTRRAVQELARSAEGKPPAAGLKEVEQVASRVRDLDPESARALEALRARLGEQAAVEAIEAIRAPAEKAQWADAAAQAQEHLRKLTVPADVARTLREFVRLGKREQTLDRVSAVLDRAGPAQPKVTAETLRQASGVRMSQTNWAATVRELAGVQDLEAFALGVPERATDIGRLKASLADVGTVLGDAKALGRVRQELACKLFLDGFPREARELLPDQGSAEHAGVLLRDLKALALGEGAVRTWPAEQALTPKAGIPPGLRPLVPEGEAGGWHPPARESPAAGLPPAEGGQAAARPERTPEYLARLEQEARRNVRRVLQVEQKVVRQEEQRLGHILHARHQQQQRDEEEERKFKAEVETLLGQKLSPVDWSLAWRLMRRQGRKAREVADRLREGRKAREVADWFREAGLSMDPFTDPYQDIDLSARLLEEEIDLCTALIEKIEQNAGWYSARGEAYSRKGDYYRAIADFTEAIRLSPRDADAHNLRGVAYHAWGDYDEAIDDFTESIHIDSTKPEYYGNRGNAYCGTGDNDKAVADFTEALRLDPKAPDRLNSLAWLWATCPDARVRNGTKAVECATRACELSSWKQATCIATLAAAYAEVGKFDEAVKWQRKALDASDRDAGARENARQRLKLYQEGKPYRQARAADQGPAPSGVGQAPAPTSPKEPGSRGKSGQESEPSGRP
jgi:tetratricopeptide (TPR) repeat protein